MRISRSRLSKIILEEKEKIVKEGGCGGSVEDVEAFPVEDSDYAHMFDDYDESYDTHGEDYFMSKDESLKSVVAIAMVTSCPITRSALLSLVDELV
tara:strand:- start:146 stop:433 length:288 start_codon:yes stop_codon:yes gene_type:complete